MIEPISPDEVASLKEKNIPDQVIAAFNDLIAKYMVGRSARFSQEAVVQRIVFDMNVTRSAIFENRWLDVETLYQGKGWQVTYDSPGYNESYPATFTFSH